MDFEDFVEPEIAVTAAVAAAIFSPRARKAIRKGVVYGMAGVLAAGDMVTSFARSVGQGVQQAGGSAAQTFQESGDQAKEEREEKGAGKEAETPVSRRKAAPKTEETKGKSA
jgi:hypothetical protein